MTGDLAIDWTRCDGHGLCAQLLPEAVRSDEWGYPIFDAELLAATDLNAVRRAVALCPSLALSVRPSPG
jgi:ferredoxin